MTPNRPALAAVCAAITDGEVRDVLSIAWERREVFRWTPDRIQGETTAWTVDTPREAFERLTLRDVLPVSWAGDSSRAFWCRGCAGHRELIARGEYSGGECPWCEGANAHPSTMPDLVAWSSLGAATILAAEELAREAARRLRPWGVAARDRRCVWKVGAIREPMPEREEKIPEGWPQDVNNQTNGDPSDERPDHWREWWAEHAPKGKRTRSTWWEAHVDLWPKDDPRPCPHEPVLALLKMGLALDALTDDALVLVVPPL